MKTRIRTGITSKKGAFNLWETCNKHKITWKEGEENDNKICKVCISKARPTKYGKSKFK